MKALCVKGNNMQWQEVVNFLGEASLISLTIAYLGKKAIESFIAGRIQAYKSNLERIATEHAIQFASLHSRRAEVIAEVYELLSDVENKARLLATPIMESGESPRNITYQSTASLLDQLFEKYNKTRIYFAEETCELIAKFINQSRLPVSFYQVAMQVAEQGPEGKEEELQKDLQKKFMKVWEEVEANVPSARKAVEREFRKILGVTSDKIT
jgi:hypothetical protein